MGLQVGSAAGNARNIFNKYNKSARESVFQIERKELTFDRNPMGVPLSNAVVVSTESPKNYKERGFPI